MSSNEALEQLGSRREGLEVLHSADATRHDSRELLLIAFCSVLAGGEGAVDMALFAEGKEPLVQGFLILANGLPGHHTFCCVERDLGDAHHRAWLAATGLRAQTSVPLAESLSTGKLVVCILEACGELLKGPGALHEPDPFGNGSSVEGSRAITRQLQETIRGGAPLGGPDSRARLPPDLLRGDHGALMNRFSACESSRFPSPWRQSSRKPRPPLPRSLSRES